ncbi:MAG: putative membrane protein [Polyangiales bacterium]|jgi:uncharacterized membrane protein
MVVGASVALTLLVLDLLFLGILAKPIYDEALGSLRRTPVYWPAALIFYAMYVTVVGRFAVFLASSRRDALKRGASLGFVAYGTYELTNWSILAGWPAILVPIDIAWGVVLTGVTALVGRICLERLG